MADEASIYQCLSCTRQVRGFRLYARKCLLKLTCPRLATPPGLLVFLSQHLRQDIGSNSGYCVTTLPGAHSQCQWTLIFVDTAKNVIGTIVVGGQEHQTGLSTVAILGSTGKYAGVTGHMISEPMPEGTFKQTLYLMPH